MAIGGLIGWPNRRAVTFALLRTERSLVSAV
jgi:hypothetical protein